MLRTITSRLLLALGLGLVAIFATQVYVRARFELPELFRLETVADGNAVEQARRGFQNQVEHLESVAEDYGEWDDAYAFAAAAPPSPLFRAFVKSNLISSTLATNHINGMVYLTPSRKVIHGVTSDVGRHAGLSRHPLRPDSLPQIIFTADRPNPEHQAEVSAGVAEGNVGPILFALDRILPTSATGKPRGDILVWRLVNQHFIHSLNHNLGVKLSFIPIAKVRDDPALLQKLVAIRHSRAGFLSRGQGRDLYWTIKDVTGRPLFLVRQPVGPREFNDQPISGSLLVAFVVSGLLLVLIAAYFSRHVISRITSADRLMNEIAATGDYGKRLVVEGDDELDRMFKQFNDMFAFIQGRENDLVRVNKRLEELSHVDAVTGIANRRGLDETLDRCWRQAARTGRSIAVLLIDIDFFKLYNDTYGHQKGDEALRRVANVLKDNLHRATDYIGRYGGEEFCVVLTDTKPDAAALVADSLLQAIRGLGIPHASSRCAKHLTVSIGIASMTAESTVIQTNLVREADTALYQAKREGRNRACTADGAGPISERHST